jgi:hypothetical protein
MISLTPMLTAGENKALNGLVVPGAFQVEGGHKNFFWQAKIPLAFAFGVEYHG